MKLNPQSILASSVFLAASAFAGPPDTKAVTPPVETDKWEFRMSMPAWATWLEGDSTLKGKTAHIDLAPGDIISRIDMAMDVRLEATKGRFSVFGEFLYLSLSDGVGTGTVVKKLDAQIDQAMGELGFGWRIVQSPRGYVDIIGGVRYTNYYQQITLQPNDQRIDEVSGRIAAAGTAVNIARELRTLDGENPEVPVAPLLGDKVNPAALAIKRVKGNTAARKEKISRILHNTLSSEASRRDEWWDPYVGVRARYNLSDKFYLAGRADIGGFGVGADLTWQAEAAFGMMMTNSIYGELGYRALGLDYDHDGLHMDTVTHGMQLTLGMKF